MMPMLASLRPITTRWLNPCLSNTSRWSICLRDDLYSCPIIERPLAAYRTRTHILIHTLSCHLNIVITDSRNNANRFHISWKQLSDLLNPAEFISSMLSEYVILNCAINNTVYASSKHRDGIIVHVKYITLGINCIYIIWINEWP